MLLPSAPLGLLAQGYDVLAKAKTGTGKTLAFLIPIAEHLAASPPPVRRTWATLAHVHKSCMCMLICCALDNTAAVLAVNVCLQVQLQTCSAYECWRHDLHGQPCAAEALCP
jgi:hypothetical protein